MKWNRALAGACPEARKIRAASRISPAESGVNGCGAADAAAMLTRTAIDARTHTPTVQPRGSVALQGFFRPPLQHFLQLRHELIRQRSIDQSMIEREG